MARPAQDLGDGPLCPESDHKLYVMKPSGVLWCPETQAIYGPSTYSEADRGFVAGVRIRDGDRAHGDGGSHAVAAEILHGAA